MAYGIHSDVAQDQFGNVVSSATVTVYTVTAGSVVVNPLPSIYTAASSITATPVTQSNPMTTDSLGRYSFGAPDGFYAIDISGSNFATYRVYRNIVAAYLPGAGGVASVSLGLPAQFAISGSPVTGTGTLTGSWNTQTANYVLAGPSSGAVAAPTFRALVAADLPVSGASAATYQTLSTTTGALSLVSFTVDTYGRITGTSTTTTTLALPGVANTWTKSQNVASVALSFASPLDTDASTGNAFHVTLTSNFTMNFPTNLVSGGTYLWKLTQDVTGGRLVTFSGNWKWPGGVAGTLSTVGGSVDLLTAYYDGTNLLCTLQKAYA
ncbi:MAG: hypothetical protein WCO52_06230 [bacterium]